MPRRSPLLLTLALLAATAAPAGAAARKRPPPDPQSLPACHDAPSFANIPIDVAITVVPAGDTWTVEASTAAVTRRFLQLINENSRGITFNANVDGTPDYTIAVSVNRTPVTVENPERDTASAVIGAPALDPTLHLDVPAAADENFSEWDDAIDRLAGDTVLVFAKGWHTDPPCRRPDGNVKE